ncbi:MAG: DUF6174 domain-containing protein, partial [Rubricoccaceae bacterium]|nr:DUF6174 domain-containing protein [Rubricoccaceae bacterium]
PTIDSMFDVIEFGFDQEADSVGVNYSTDTGRPDRITVDFRVGIADDELELFVEDFQVTD